MRLGIISAMNFLGPAKFWQRVLGKMVHQVRVNLQDLYSDYESNINLKIAYSVRLCLPEKLISESTSLGIEPTSLSLESNQARYPLSNQG